MKTKCWFIFNGASALKFEAALISQLKDGEIEEAYTA